MPSLSPQEITLAYRRLHRTLLRAVQYSKPGRFVVRDRIRTAFRSSSHVDYDAKRFERTLEFFDGAARVHSLEHKIVKNLVHVWWERGKLAGVRLRETERPFRRMAYEDFDRTVAMLNRDLGLCIM